MCGIIKPTKPTFPTKATAVPVKKITDKIAIALTSFVRCPKLIETSSPNERMVIDFDINNAKIFNYPKRYRDFNDIRIYLI